MSDRHLDPAVPDPRFRDQLAGWLAAHRLTTPRQCACGWREEGDGWERRETWPEHVAAEVEARVQAAAAPLLAKLRAVEEAVVSLHDTAKVIEHEVLDAEPSQYKANQLGKAMGYRRSAMNLRHAAGQDRA